MMSRRAEIKNTSTKRKRCSAKSMEKEKEPGRKKKQRKRQELERQARGQIGLWNELETESLLSQWKDLGKEPLKQIRQPRVLERLPQN